MPVSKKRKKAARTQEPSSGGGGMMSRMRGGLKSVAGQGPKKEETLLSKLLTWALVLLAAYFVARRFGLVP